MYCGYIVELTGLQKHSNADRLQLCTVFGNTVIVDMSYYEGQKVVFFPTDGQLGKEFAEENNLVRIKNEDGTNSGGYLDPEKRNIKAMKLRGEKSEGLVLPVESLSKWTNVNDLSIGDKITTLSDTVICQKYIPKRNSRNNSNKSNLKSKIQLKTKFPYFKEHVDTEQLMYNLGAFKPGDTCYITLKMHGTSGRTSNTLKFEQKKQNMLQRLLHKKPPVVKTWSAVTGTRRVVLDNNITDGWYGTNEFREKYHRIFEDNLPKGMEVFYEIVGWVDGTDTTIMGRCANSKVKDKAFTKLYGEETVFSYGCEPKHSDMYVYWVDGTDTTIMGRCANSKVKDKAFTKLYGEETVFSYGCEPKHSDMYVYRMTMTNEDGVVTEIPWEEVKLWCERLGVKYVPEFDKFLFTTKEDLLERVEKYYEGPDPIGKTHVREGVVVRIDNRSKFTAYKHKNFEFKCLEGIIKDTSDAPDMEEEQEELL